MTADISTELPEVARNLLAHAGLDLHVFDTEIQFAQIEAMHDQEGSAA